MLVLTLSILLRFLWGWSVAQSFVVRREVSEKYLLNSFWVVLGGSLSLALFLYLQDTLDHSVLYAGLSILLGNAAYTWGRHVLWRLGGVVLYTLAPLCFLYQNIWQTINFVLGSLLLGSIFAAMFLGHWYLNVAGLHINELKRLNKLCLISLYAKIAELLIHFFLGHWTVVSLVDPMGRSLKNNLKVVENLEQLTPSASLFGLTGDLAMGLGIFGLLMLLARLLWGLVAPVILLHLTHRTVAMRATQSATGLLYATCVMALLGEATAIYLYSVLGWYL